MQSARTHTQDQFNAAPPAIAPHGLLLGTLSCCARKPNPIPTDGPLAVGDGVGSCAGADAGADADIGVDADAGADVGDESGAAGGPSIAEGAPAFEAEEGVELSKLPKPSPRSWAAPKLPMLSPRILGGAAARKVAVYV